jgi:hypothetical protein
MRKLAFTSVVDVAEEAPATHDTAHGRGRRPQRSPCIFQCHETPHFITQKLTRRLEAIGGVCAFHHELLKQRREGRGGERGRGEQDVTHVVWPEVDRQIIQLGQHVTQQRRVGRLEGEQFLQRVVDFDSMRVHGGVQGPVKHGLYHGGGQRAGVWGGRLASDADAADAAHLDRGDMTCVLAYQVPVIRCHRGL